MKITSFSPMVVTSNAEDLIKVFEALGFERRHTKTGINDKDITAITMKNADGFMMTIAQASKSMPDLPVIRMNVDSFAEAYEFLTAHGFKNAQGDKVTDTSSSKATLMVSPSGFAINVAEHIK